MTPIRNLRGQANAQQVQAQIAPRLKDNSMTWKRYGVGAVNAFISGFTGGAGSFGAGQLFGVSASVSLKIAGVTAVGSGLMSFFKWLNQHPLPGADS